jgi:choline dehydrogenase-like flavoprotein
VNRREIPDVLIVGAGPSGAVTARYLSASGFRVVCLEQGGYVDTATYPSDRPDWELLAGGEWHYDPNVRRRPEDYPINNDDSDVTPLMFNGVGGSSIMYGGHWMRFLPSDFRVRTLDGAADDWPISYEDLLPYYEINDLDFGVSGLQGDPAYPPSAAPPNPPIAIGKLGQVAARGMDALGWHWWPGTNAIASRPYQELGACARRGTCGTGCPEGAKASVDVTHWPIAESQGVQLITGARVTGIQTDQQGLATGAVYIDRQGQEQFQPAQVVVLAANGIGTPRLLLLSASGQWPHGLANSSGQVGRRLMMHPYVGARGVFEEPIESWVGPWGQSIYSLQFYETEPERGFIRGAKWAAMPTGGPLFALSGYGRGLDAGVWGPNIHDIVREQVGHMLEWGVIIEDLPDEANRVTLDPELTDSDGLPAPKVTYRTSENSERISDFNAARATEALEASGAIKVMPNRVRDTGWHLLGTARMGSDAASSVVDQWGRAHDVPNLYVVDGSTFVTSSGLNPTATICAFALRATDRLIRERRNQEVPV